LISQGWLSDVTWSGNQFIAVGRSHEPDAILASSDGVNWTLQSTGITGGLSGVASSESQFIAVGFSGAITTSPDGATWTERSTGRMSGSIDGVTWGGDQFVAVGSNQDNYSNSNIGVALTSQDGAIWTSQFSGMAGDLDDVAWSGNQLVAVGWFAGLESAGAILTSPDGATWTSLSSGSYRLNRVTWGDGQYIAVGSVYSPSYGTNIGAILSSWDGRNWYVRSALGSYNVDYVLSSVTWGSGQFVAVGWKYDRYTYVYSSMILTSPNGVAWSEQTSGITGYLNSVTWGSGRFVAVGINYNPYGDAILTSTDGITWTPRSSGTISQLSAVAWGNGQFVATGSDTVLISLNGVRWQKYPLGITNGISKITWNGNQFIAVGGSGTILSSACP
jgi:hypothetical protein